MWKMHLLVVDLVCPGISMSFVPPVVGTHDHSFQGRSQCSYFWIYFYSIFVAFSSCVDYSYLALARNYNHNHMHLDYWYCQICYFVPWLLYSLYNSYVFGSLVICFPVLVIIFTFLSAQYPSTTPDLSCPFFWLTITTTSLILGTVISSFRSLVLVYHIVNRL